MASVAIERYTGVETIPHLTPRDMTVAGLESILLGSHAEGVRNILAVTGDPPESRRLPRHAHGVRLRLDRARRADGAAEPRRGLPRPRDRRADVVLPRRRGQPDRRRPRARGRALPAEGRGGRALRDDAAALRSRAARACSRSGIGGTWPIPVLVGVWPIRTYETLVRMHNEMPGLVIPDHVLERYRAAGPAARDVGLALGHELIEGARAVAQGVYVDGAVQAADERRRAAARASRLAGRAVAGRYGRRLRTVERATDERGRHAETARLRRARLAKIVDCDRAGRVDCRAAGVAVAHAPATAVIVRAHRAVPVRVAREDDCRRPMRPGIAVSGPFSG